MIPNLHVILLSDIGINALLQKDAPIHIALWIHRYSLYPLLAALTAIILLIFKIKKANYISAIVLSFFIMYSLSLLGGPPIEESERVFERLEYNNEAYGLFVEKIVRAIFYIFELLLVYTLIMSKRIKSHFENQHEKS